MYVVDKEYITVKEAKKWERGSAADWNDLAIYEPDEAPDLQSAIKLLIDRVNSVDSDGVRLTIAPDQRMIGRNVVRQKTVSGSEHCSFSKWLCKNSVSQPELMTGLSNYPGQLPTWRIQTASFLPI